MNNLTVLFGILFCLVAVNARHYGDRVESERLTDDDEQRGTRRQVDHTSQSRHRRRRWEMSGGYEYQPPRYDYRYDRRDYYSNQQDVIPQIFKLLDEITTYIKRPQAPPPPPQPIYIPYPVPYFVPKVVICKTQVTKAPNVTNRFPEMEDTNQNWGFITSNENTDDYDDNDGARPISFDPIRPKQNMKRPAPSVEHGSSQFDIPLTTRAPFVPESREPNMCHAAVLSCCGSSDEPSQKKCFLNIGCSVNFDGGKMCSSEAVTEALESFKKAYSPIN